MSWYQMDRLDPDSREKDVMTKEEAKGRKVGCPGSKGVLVGGGKGKEVRRDKIYYEMRWDVSFGEEKYFPLK